MSLASLRDGTGTDDQNIVGCGLSGTNLTIGIEGGGSQSISLASLGADGNGIYSGNGTISSSRSVSFNGNNLTIGISNGSSQTVTLPTFSGDGSGIYVAVGVSQIIEVWI